MMPKHVITAGAVLVLTAAPALAELSAQEVWADWQQTYGALGMTISATDTYADGTLTLDGLTATMDLGGIESTSSYGSLALIENADGTISIEIPASIAMTTETTVEGETITQTIVLENEGWIGTISEDGDARTYDISAAVLTYVFDGLGGDLDGADLTGRMSMQNLETRYVNTQTGDSLASDQTLTADGMVLAMSVAGPDAFDLTYELGTITSDASGTIDLANLADSPTLSEMGVNFSGDIRHNGSTLSVSADSGDGPVMINGTSESGHIGFDLNSDSLGYSFGSKGAEIAVQLAAFPVPVNLSVAELSTGLALPVGASDEPKPFALSLAYRDLAIDDALWGLFDPTGQLPRDAATLLLDLSGTAVMKVDLFGGDPEALAGLQGAPGELKTMELNQLLLSLAGAELTGDGAVTFPTPGPVPLPVGKVNLTLNGGLALIDKLVALGFVPAEQAAFLKGMAGVVAKPVGEDELVSEIEFTEGGGITANGLPLQ